jgi:hypothetical protein
VLEYRSVAVLGVLVQELCDNLVIHATLEEEMFYPALAKWGGEEGHRFVEDALREHRDIKECINDVQRMDVGGSEFRTRLRRLEQAVVRMLNEKKTSFLWPRLACRSANWQSRWISVACSLWPKCVRFQVFAHT